MRKLLLAALVLLLAAPAYGAGKPCEELKSEIDAKLKEKKVEGYTLEIVANDDVKELKDINGREFTMLALLAIAVLVMGLYPKPFTDVMNVSVADLLKHVALSKLN